MAFNNLMPEFLLSTQCTFSFSLSPHCTTLLHPRSQRILLPSLEPSDSVLHFHTRIFLFLQLNLPSRLPVILIHPCFLSISFHLLCSHLYSSAHPILLFYTPHRIHVVVSNRIVISITNSCCCPLLTVSALNPVYRALLSNTQIYLLA